MGFTTREEGIATVEAAVESVLNTYLNACARPADTISQQSINLVCTPPDNWENDVYNGEFCRMMRSAPPGTYTKAQICNACNACCASELNQNSYVKFTEDCQLTPLAVLGMRNNLRDMLPKSNALDMMLSEITADRINEGIRKVITLQSINIQGTGVVRRVHQDIAVNVVYQLLRTERFKRGIEAFVDAVIAEQAAANTPIDDQTPDRMPDEELNQINPSTSQQNQTEKPIDNPKSENIEIINTKTAIIGILIIIISLVAVMMFRNKTKVQVTGGYNNVRNHFIELDGGYF